MKSDPCVAMPARWLDAIDACVVVTHADGSVAFANHAARSLLGIRDDGVGDPLDAWIVMDDAVQPLPGQLLPFGQERRVWTCRAVRNPRIELEFTVRRVEGEQPSTCQLLLVFRNVSDERETEASHRRFEHLAAMGTMVAGFAHEVLNPVASLRSLAESLDEDLLELGISTPHIGRMLRVLQRIERLVQSSLQLGRPSSPNRVRVRPWSLLSHALAGVGPRTRALGQEVRVEVEPELPDLYVDEAQLAQVLVIFLNNAIDATGAARRVLLRAVRGRARDPERRTLLSADDSRGVVRLEVVDDGPGVSPELAERIFDPFFSTKASGTGLGLSIAQRLVSGNGGTVELSSVPDVSTSFAVVIPCDNRVSVAPPPPPA